MTATTPNATRPVMASAVDAGPLSDRPTLGGHRTGRLLGPLRVGRRVLLTGVALASLALASCQTTTAPRASEERTQTRGTRSFYGTSAEPAGSAGSDRASSAAERTISGWLRVEIAGGTTWINLDRVESIRRLSRNIPAGSLPILVIDYGSGSKSELVFDSFIDLERAISTIEAGIRRVGR